MDDRGTVKTDTQTHASVSIRMKGTESKMQNMQKLAALTV